MEHAMEPLIPLIQVDESADEPATPFDTLYHREYHAMVRMATALVDYRFSGVGASLRRNQKPRVAFLLSIFEPFLIAIT